MNEEKKIKRATQFGGLGKQQEAVKNDYSTLGGAKDVTPRLPDAQTTKAPDAQTTKHPDAQTTRIKRQRHTVYLDPDLLLWLRSRLADNIRDGTKEDMSDIVNMALRALKKREER